MIIDCLADLHGYFPELEGGDLLIIAGDLTSRDMEEEYDDFWRWLCYQPYKKKIVIAGNHDTFIENNPDYLTDCGDDIVYLCDSGTEFEGLKIWGSPWTRRFHGMNPKCMAFTYAEEKDVEEKFSLIPDDIDILITHGPPWGYWDLIARAGHVGSESLAKYVKRVTPSLHVFGHIHEHGGNIFKHNEIKFINASHVNEVYDPINKPVRIVIDKDPK